MKEIYGKGQLKTTNAISNWPMTSNEYFSVSIRLLNAVWKNNAINNDETVWKRCNQ